MSLEKESQNIQEKEGLLFVTRKLDQGVGISIGVHLSVMGLEKHKVKVGIKAIPSINVIREEIFDPSYAYSREYKGEGYLILSRKINQGIVINKMLIARIVEITKDNVKLSFKAPKDIKILRDELLKEPENANFFPEGFRVDVKNAGY